MDEVGQNDEVDAQNTTASNTLDYAPREHCRHGRSCRTNDTTNREKDQRSQEHELATERVCESRHDWLTNSVCEQVAGCYPVRLDSGGIQGVSDRLKVKSIVILHFIQEFTYW